MQRKPNEIVVSLHPKWSELVKGGDKTIEVRTKPLPNLSKVLIYETKKDGGQGKIVGEFYIDGIDVYFVNSHKGVVGYSMDEFEKTRVSERDLMKYANGKNYLYFHHITSVKWYDEPILLEETGLTFPPQFFSYIKKGDKIPARPFNLLERAIKNIQTKIKIDDWVENKKDPNKFIGEYKGKKIEFYLWENKTKESVYQYQVLSEKNYQEGNGTGIDPIWQRSFFGKQITINIENDVLNLKKIFDLEVA